MAYHPMQLAEAFLKTGELHDALDALNQQLESHPTDQEALRLRIQVCLRLASPDNLQQALHDLAQLEQTTENLLLASIVYERSANPDAALTAIQSARQLNPDDERLTERELTLYLSAQRYPEALELVRQQPRSWRWLEREGDVLVLLGDDLMATARYGLVLANLEDAAERIREDYLHALQGRVLLARAHAYRRLQHLEQARHHYHAAQELLPDDPTIDFNLGILDLLDGKFEQAVTQCRAAYQQAPQALREEMIASIQPDGFMLLRRALFADNKSL